MTARGTDCIAVVNAGSSSIKFGLYAADGLGLLFHGLMEKIGIAPSLSVRDASGAEVLRRDWTNEELPAEAAAREIVSVEEHLPGGHRIVAAGHRVVHGGLGFSDPVLVTPAVVAELETLVPLAPLHQPFNLAPIRALAEHFSNLPQVACFDTAFHRGQSRVAQSFGLPRAYYEEGVRRFGFHGLSYEFVASELRRLSPRLAAGRTIVAHLGNGASLCGMLGGRSVATTMGFTAADGLLMGTRCGALDPGVVVYLMDRHGLDARGIEDLIYRRSGLLGVSGVSSDMRTLRESAAPEAREALDLFVYRIVREIGSLAAALGGLDGLVFTAGIGEHDAATRREVAAGCAWLGVTVEDRPGAGARRIDAPGSGVEVWVVPTDEELTIARHTVGVLGGDSNMARQ